MARAAVVIAAGTLWFLSACSQPAYVPGVDPFCSTRPQLLFCEDFDGAKLPGAFDRTSVVAAELVADEAFALSPARSLRVTSTGGTDPSEARLFESFPFGPKLRAFFQMRLDETLPKGQGAAEIVALSFLSGGAPYRLALVMNTDGTWSGVEQGATEQRFTATGQVPLGEWTSVRLNVDIPFDGTPKLTAFFGDETVIDAAAITPPEATSLSDATFSVGLASDMQGQSGWRMHFDNVTLRTE